MATRNSSEEQGLASERQRLHMWITGRVQGVGFRAFVQQLAVQHRLSGWVRNAGSNQVELIAVGPQQVLEAFAVKVSAGPGMGRVDNYQQAWELDQESFSAFTIKSSR